ncbi:MAG: hypothetical protein ABIN04_15290 [Ginsengibacter sp.]
MSYSTIKPKHCKCGCNHYPTISYNGWYAPHAPDEIKEKVGNRKKQVQRKANERARIRSLNQLEGNREMVSGKIGIDSELENYFRLASGELYMNPFCMECNDVISPTIKRLKGDEWVEVDNFRNCTAHIFPKSEFYSVRANPYNKLYLCCKNGCHERTHRLDTFSKMKIFPEAARKYELFKDQITETHKYKGLFEEYINQLNTK